MPAGTVKMGFEGMLYYGAPGATATTLLENCQDIKIDRSVERGKTTVRGDSTVPPVETEDVVLRMVGIEFTMIHDTTDTAFAALMDHVADGTGCALRGKSHSAGKGPDADFTLSASEPWPLGAEQAVTFTASPSRSYGRAPLANV